MGDQEPFSHRKVWITFFEFITIIIIIIIIVHHHQFSFKGVPN